MIGGKNGLGINVLEAAQRRITDVFDNFPRVYLSYSGGKDSTVMLHLTVDEARRRARRFGVLFVDLEGQYRLTIDHIVDTLAAASDVIDPYWCSLPLSLRNAVSQFEPQWLTFDPERKDDWIRSPPKMAITEPLPEWHWFKKGMEFEDFVPEFGWWYAQDKLCACLVGIRADESLNRYRTVKHETKQKFRGRNWTTHVGRTLYNAYPIYDWRTEDIWTYHGKTGRPYNRLYDRMNKAGLGISQQRICQPYGDDQRKGLWLFHLIEPETWARVVARVNGANQGALYARESGNINGTIKVSCPEGHTWESFARLLLDSMPERTKEHFDYKITVFLRWWQSRGIDPIPDVAGVREEAGKTAPSWRRICKTLLRNDYWCKGLSFTQHKSCAYERYRDLMKRRQKEWDLAWCRR